MDNAPLYRALADETRRSIIRLLLSGSYCVSALAGKLNISESAVSQHLKVLRQAMLLHGEKRGYYMHYDIDRERLLDLARDIEAMAAITRPAVQQRSSTDSGDPSPCSKEVRRFCHGTRLRTLPMAPIPGKEE